MVDPSLANPSLFRGTLDFFQQLGVYDVVLPFLLTFTIVFAIMEKTKIFGMEKVGDKEFTKKNLNAMIAFVLAFFVVASSQLVAIINQTMGQIVLLLLLSICFLMLVGSFHQDNAKGFFLDKDSWAYKVFMVLMFVGIILIFLNALGWLDIGFTYIRDHWDSTAVGAAVLMILIILFMFFIVRDRAPPKEAKG